MKIFIINIVFVISNLLYYCQNSINSEEIQIPQNINALLDVLPLIFDKLTISFFRSECTYSDKLTYNYFKTIESNTKIKYYLNQKENNLSEVIDNIIKLFNVTSKNYKNLYKFVENFLSSFNEEDCKNLEWKNQIIASVPINGSDSVYYGNIFAIKKGNKIDIIFCYGSVSLNSISFENGYFDYSEYININNVNIQETHVSYVSTIGLERGDKTFMNFLRLAGLKIIGNIYGIDLPYPRFNGFY